MKLDNVAVLLTTGAGLSACLGVVYNFVSEYIFSITGSTALAGSLIAIRSVITIILLILGGYLADIIGRKIPLYIGTLFIGISYFFYAFAQTSEGLLLAVIIEGTAYFYMPAFNAMIMDSTSGNRLVRVFTLSAVLINFPFSLTAIIGGILRDIYGLMGLRIGFLMTGIGIIIIAIARGILLRETHRERILNRNRLFIDAYSGTFRDLHKFHPLVRWLIALRALLLLNSLSIIVYFSILYVVRFTSLMSFTEWGFITSISSILYLIAPFIGRRVEKLKTAPLYTILLGIQGIATLLFLSNSRIAVFIALASLNISGAMSYGIEKALVAKVTESSLRARVESYMNISYYMGMAIGSLIGGLLYSYQPPLALMAAALFLFIGMVPGLIIFRKAENIH